MHFVRGKRDGKLSLGHRNQRELDFIDRNRYPQLMYHTLSRYTLASIYSSTNFRRKILSTGTSSPVRRYSRSIFVENSRDRKSATSMNIPGSTLANRKGGSKIARSVGALETD